MANRRMFSNRIIGSARFLKMPPIDSVYKSLLLRLVPEAETVQPKPRSDVKDNSKRVNGPSTVSVGKDRLGKVKKKNTLLRIKICQN
jgi:hypothetical protein